MNDMCNTDISYFKTVFVGLKIQFVFTLTNKYSESKFGLPTVIQHFDVILKEKTQTRINVFAVKSVLTFLSSKVFSWFFLVTGYFDMQIYIWLTLLVCAFTKHLCTGRMWQKVIF